uniref:Chondroitin sulfate proteoglycan 4 n=1 Tax=Ditylenchus dipsaci TaxID=166011 RepID=A0A915DY13_9BILA
MELSASQAQETSRGSIQQLIYLGEPLQVVENEAAAIQWKNLYLFPEHKAFGVLNEDVRFQIIDGPQHGRIHSKSDGAPLQSFNYADVLSQHLEYRHDGSETSEDSFDVQVTIDSLPEINQRFRMSNIYAVTISIEPRDDPPQISIGSKGPIISLAAGARIQLSELHLRVWDDDTPTHEVWMEVQSAQGVRITDKKGRVLTRFNLAQLLNSKVYLITDGGSGEIEFLARDSSSASPSSITCVPPLSLCPSKEDRFQLCSNFEQSDIDGLRIRYRHMSSNRPQGDSFSFQVHCAETSSIVHVFHFTFIPTSIRVFIQESLLLNNTDQGVISSRNLMATAFPQNFPRHLLLYHIVEPPKFGMLLRRIQAADGSSKLRRIGVSSNFTQEHVDSQSVVYKLHFVHYSVVNDFFSFRLITPAVSSELLRFEITYIPGGNAIHLLNRTLIVSEGSTQQITNNTLWLKTADDSAFTFTLTVPPFNGRLVAGSDVGGKFFLDSGGTFTSSTF